MDTHVHADHVTGIGMLKKIFGPTCKSVVPELSGGRADILVKNAEVLKCGNIELDCRNTPGKQITIQFSLMCLLDDRYNVGWRKLIKSLPFQTT